VGATPLPSGPDVTRRMKATQQRDTLPELALRSRLHALGYRYRVDTSPIPGLRRRADLIFSRARVAVYVDGCFWHSCPKHGTWPKANAEWWQVKIGANVARDRDTDRALVAAGWRVVRVWEHEPAERAIRRVAAAVARGRRWR
jgi:DNA mismatch endonuclease (patch repair protein)